MGAFTFTMSAVPGTPAIQNIIPCQYFGTNAFAAPVISIIATLIMIGFGMAWLNTQAKAARLAGETYGNHVEKIMTNAEGTKVPNFWVSFIPVVMVILTNYMCVKYVFPNIDTSYLQEEKYPNAEGLISYLGIGGVPRIEINARPFTTIPGDKVLLCSDGLYKRVSEEEMKTVLETETGTSEKVNVLLQTALERGGAVQDNTSAILLEIF